MYPFLVRQLTCDDMEICEVLFAPYVELPFQPLFAIDCNSAAVLAAPPLNALPSACPYVVPVLEETVLNAAPNSCPQLVSMEKHAFVELPGIAPPCGQLISSPLHAPTPPF